MVRYELNNPLNGIEIYFDSIPSVVIRDEIKASGFRWNGSKKCWYAKQTEERLELAKKIAAGTFESQQNAVVSSPILDITTEEVEPPMTRKYCYAASLEEFMAIKKATWKKEMRSAFKEEIDLPLGQSQIDAWADCYDVLQKELVGDLTGFSIVFEYVLPYENGRRPDVLLVSNEVVIILEFKRKSVVLIEDLDHNVTKKTYKLIQSTKRLITDRENIDAVIRLSIIIVKLIDKRFWGKAIKIFNPYLKEGYRGSIS